MRRANRELQDQAELRGILERGDACRIALVDDGEPYKLDTAHMTVEEVKKEVWRYTFGYYNTIRVTTVTEGGYPPSYYKRKVPAAESVA